MATCFGWTYEYIDEFVTVPRLKEIAQYHKHTPPLHVLVAQHFGFGKQAQGSTDMSAFVGEAVALGADPTPLMP